MLVRWSIDPVRRLVMVKFSGRLTFHDLQTYIADLRSDSGLDPSFGELVDLVEVSSTELNYGKSAVLSEGADPFSLESRRACVLVNEAVHHVARMYQKLRDESRDSGETPHIRAFRTVEEAQRWLQTD